MNKFLSEILEQKKALKNTLSYFMSDEFNSVSKLKNKKFRHLIFTGMGSSNFSSQYSATLLNDLAYKVPSYSINTSELLHYQLNLITPDTLLICTSQSGESYEIKEILKKINKNTECLGITNEANSSLAHHSDTTLLIKAGKEEMTSTKTFVSSLLVSYLLGKSLTGMHPDKWIEDIKNVINIFEFEHKTYLPKIQQMIDFLGDLPALVMIARGPAQATAQQTALMFKEGIKIAGFSMSGGEFRHGPMEMVQKGFKSIIWAPTGKTYRQNIKMAEDIIRFDGKVLLITNSDYQNDNPNIMIEKIPVTDEYLFAIASILPMQLFVDQYAKNKGFEAGNFSRGAKITSIE